MHTRYYLSSPRAPAAELLAKVRAHWSIEYSLHWVLDIAFREDESLLRKDFGLTNFAILRHIALNLIKQEQSLKLCIKNKRLNTGWDHDYLLAISQPILFLVSLRWPCDVRFLKLTISRK